MFITQLDLFECVDFETEIRFLYLFDLNVLPFMKRSDLVLFVGSCRKFNELASMERPILVLFMMQSNMVFQYFGPGSVVDSAN